MLRSTTAEQRAEGYDTGPVELLLRRHRDLRYPYRCVFGEALLDIDEGVFCPTLTRVSPLLLRSLKIERGQRVLDVFSGSGAFAIIAALRRASHVVAIDMSPRANRCALKNAERNGVSEVLDVRTGTFADCVSSFEKFDVIVANPPLLPGVGADSLSCSVLDPGLQSTTAFIKRLHRHLAPAGRSYFMTSDVMDRLGHDVDRLCEESGLVSVVIDKLDTGGETYRVHEARLTNTDASASGCSASYRRADWHRDEG